MLYWYNVLIESKSEFYGTRVKATDVMNALSQVKVPEGAKIAEVVRLMQVQ